MRDIVTSVVEVCDAYRFMAEIPWRIMIGDIVTSVHFMFILFVTFVATASRNSDPFDR